MKLVLKDCHSRTLCRRATLLRRLSSLPATGKDATVRLRRKLTVGPPVQPNTLDTPQTDSRAKPRLEKLKAKPDPKTVQEKGDTPHHLSVLLKARAWKEAAQLYLKLRAKNAKVPHSQESSILKGMPWIETCVWIEFVLLD